jgi:hypothetical protein
MSVSLNIISYFTRITAQIYRDPLPPLPTFKTNFLHILEPYYEAHMCAVIIDEQNVRFGAAESDV